MIRRRQGYGGTSNTGTRSGGKHHDMDRFWMIVLFVILSFAFIHFLVCVPRMKKKQFKSKGKEVVAVAQSPAASLSDKSAKGKQPTMTASWLASLPRTSWWPKRSWWRKKPFKHEHWRMIQGESRFLSQIVTTWQ
jgi:hypothetical protein